MKNSFVASQIELILWDFDGVLINSNEIREHGFLKVLAGFPEKHTTKLLNFHRMNGGLSRYVKFRYFIEECLKETASDEIINAYANSFSAIMQEFLVDKNLLIPETINFVKTNYLKVPMHIVSGSDQAELQSLCKQLDIAKYFISINGSPTTKSLLVSTILADSHAEIDRVVLVGDSINDYNAAHSNGIKFSAYNNESLERLSDVKIV